MICNMDLCRQNQSCETQVAFIYYELMFNHDKDIQPDNIIINFTKAFDKVPTNIYSTSCTGMVSTKEDTLFDPVIFK